jgi:hypothetical protein
METYEQIIAEITDKIKTNGNKEITGAILQGVLLGIIAAVQANQQGKLEYYSEDKEDGVVNLSGELLDIVRIIAGTGLTVDTEDFQFRLQHSGLEIRDKSGTAVLKFNSYGLETSVEIDASTNTVTCGALIMNDPNGNKFITYINSEGQLITEPYEE